MNPFAIKIVFFGTVGLFAGCLTLSLGIPAVVWQALGMIAAGCLLIYIGGRNLFDGVDKPSVEQSLVSLGGIKPQNTQWQRGQTVGLFGGEKSADAQTPSDRAGSIFATLGVTLMCAVTFAVLMGLNIAAESHKREKAAPVREVLDPLRLDPLKSAGEEWLVSLMGLPPEEARVLDESRRLLQSHEYEAVIKLLNMADADGPWFGGRLFYVGYALQHLGRNQEAEKLLSEFVAVQERTDVYNAYRRETRYYRARALMALDRPHEAEADLSFAIRIKPAAELHQLRGEVFAKLAMYEKAAADRRRAAELDPQPASLGYIRVDLPTKAGPRKAGQWSYPDRSRHLVHGCGRPTFSVRRCSSRVTLGVDCAFPQTFRTDAQFLEPKANPLGCSGHNRPFLQRNVTQCAEVTLDRRT